MTARSGAPVAVDAARVLAAGGLGDGWRPADAEQERLRSLYLAHVSQHEDAMWRECTSGHLTASTVVVDATHTRVLLTLHPKVHRWLQLGGHCEPGDTSLCEAALREAREESGIDGLELVSPMPARLDRHLVPCAGPGTSVAHLDVQYVAVAPEGARERISDESLDLAWWPVDDLPDDADEALRAIVRTAQSMLASDDVSPSSGLSPSDVSGTVSGADVRLAKATPSR